MPLDDLEKKELEAMRSSIERLQLQASAHQTQDDRIEEAIFHCKNSIEGIRDRVSAMSDRVATIDNRTHQTSTENKVILESLQAQSRVLDQHRAIFEKLLEQKPRRGPRISKHRGRR